MRGDEMAMAKFKDAAGRTWLLSITVGMLPRIKEAGLDLSELFKGKVSAVDLLTMNPATLGRVLWVLCEKEAEVMKVTPEQFAEGFDGPTLFEASDAFIEAIVNFRHRPVVAEAVKAELPAARERLEKAQIAAIKSLMTGTSNDTAGSSPASSESIPTT